MAWLWPQILGATERTSDRGGMKREGMKSEVDV